MLFKFLKFVLTKLDNDIWISPNGTHLVILTNNNNNNNDNLFISGYMGNL